MSLRVSTHKIKNLQEQSVYYSKHWFILHSCHTMPYSVDQKVLCVQSPVLCSAWFPSVLKAGQGLHWPAIDSCEVYWPTPSQAVARPWPTGYISYICSLIDAASTLPAPHGCWASIGDTDSCSPFTSVHSLPTCKRNC